MNRGRLFSGFSAANFFVFAGIGCALAETLPVGPLDWTVRVNDVDIPLTLKGAADINTAKGDFNVNGEITVSSATSKLRDEILAVSATILPVRIPTPACTLLLNRISPLEISSKDNEADIDATAHLSLRCGLINSDDTEAKLKLAVIAKVLKGNRLSWSIPRRPELGIPNLWWFFLNLAKGNPNDYARNILQQLLNDHGTIQLPAIDDVRAALQGANFDGDKNTISFRVKGDAHSNGAKLASLLAEFLKTQKFSFTVPKPQ
jgi:hypothetical protein